MLGVIHFVQSIRGIPSHITHLLVMTRHPPVVNIPYLSNEENYQPVLSKLYHEKAILLNLLCWKKEFGCRKQFQIIYTCNPGVKPLLNANEYFVAGHGSIFEHFIYLALNVTPPCAVIHPVV